MINYKKYIDYFTTKIKIVFCEKIYTKNGINLKYMLEREMGSDVLIVVFSACTRPGIRARYNYVRTLKEVKANKLFILDDFAPDHHGAYYLGKEHTNNIEVVCKALIEEIMLKLKINKAIACGSSKGGYAALNLALDLKKCDCIIGAPQYKLADYLDSPGLEVTRDYIIPHATEGQRALLNTYLSKKIKTINSEDHKVFIHYSSKEHTYCEHVCYLLNDLKNNGFEIVRDEAEYLEHGDVSKYFPVFLVNVLHDNYGL